MPAEDPRDARAAVDQAPVAISREGETLNINADTFASALAARMKAKRLLLAGAGVWAAAPGRREERALFGEHGHWTSLIIALPIGFGIAAAAELWHMLRGTAG